MSAGVPKCSTRQAERSPLPSLFRRWPVWPRPGASLRHTRLCERSACWRPLALSRSSEISTPHDDAGSPTTRRDVYLCDLYTVPPRRRQLPWCRGVRMTQGSAGRTRHFRERRIGRRQVAGAGHGASTTAAVAGEICRDLRRVMALNASGEVKQGGRSGPGRRECLGRPVCARHCVAAVGRFFAAESVTSLRGAVLTSLVY